MALPAYAQADLLKHALDGQSPGGTGSGSATAPTSQENDLVTWAGEAKPITLPELLQLAIRQAPALASAKLDIAVAEAQIAETWARHDWTVGAQVNFAKAGSSIFSGIQLQGTTSASASVDIGRVLPTGGTIDLKADTNYSHTDASSIFPESTYWTSDIVGSITQPLLKGYGSDLYNAQERRATLTRDVAVLARRLAALNTIEAVVSAYWDLVLAEQQVAITEQSLALARERLRVTEIQVKGGKVADAEVPAVQQIIATREEDVLNGELAVLDRSIALRRAVGMPIGANELGLRVTTDLGATETKLDLADLIERTYNASPELAELGKQDQASTIDIDVNDNGLLPQLDLALQAGPRGTDRLFGSSE
ncbi:MAG TPA: TolC family protein, partial [Kofleriaceae bacterium]